MADEKSIAPEENYHLLERKKWWKKWLIPNCALIVMIIAPWAWLMIYIISYDSYNESYFSIFGVLSIIAFIYTPIWALITRSTNRWGLLAVVISLIPLWLIYIPPWEMIPF